MKKYILILISLCLSTSLFANVAIPRIILLEIARIYLIIPIILLLEFIAFSWFLPQVPKLKIAIAILAMNVASSLIGGFFIASIDIILQHTMLARSSENISYIVSGIYFVTLTTILNSCIEFPVAWLILNKQNAKKLFIYTIYINAASALFLFLSLAFYEYIYGSIY